MKFHPPLRSLRTLRPPSRNPRLLKLFNRFPPSFRLSIRAVLFPAGETRNNITLSTHPQKRHLIVKTAAHRGNFERDAIFYPLYFPAFPCFLSSSRAVYSSDIETLELQIILTTSGRNLKYSFAGHLIYVISFDLYKRPFSTLLWIFVFSISLMRSADKAPRSFRSRRSRSLLILSDYPRVSRVFSG